MRENCYAIFMTTNERKFKILFNEARIAGLEAGSKVNMFGCGFAWINIKPSNSGFANWCRDNGKGKNSSYEGGLNMYVHDFGQNLVQKEAFAAAFVAVIAKAGI